MTTVRQTRIKVVQDVILKQIEEGRLIRPPYANRTRVNDIAFILAEDIVYALFPIELGQNAALGRKLACLRKKQGLTQRKLIYLLRSRGVIWTQPQLSRVESGNRVVRASELFHLADALGVSVSELAPDALEVG